MKRKTGNIQILALFAGIFAILIFGCASDNGNVPVDIDPEITGAVQDGGVDLIAAPVGPVTPKIDGISIEKGDAENAINVAGTIANPAGELRIEIINMTLDPDKVYEGTAVPCENDSSIWCFEIEDVPLADGDNELKIRLYQDNELVHAFTVILSKTGSFKINPI